MIPAIWVFVVCCIYTRVRYENQQRRLVCPSCFFLSFSSFRPLPGCFLAASLPADSGDNEQNPNGDRHRREIEKSVSLPPAVLWRPSLSPQRPLAWLPPLPSFIIPPPSKRHLSLNDTTIVHPIYVRHTYRHEHTHTHTPEAVLKSLFLSREIKLCGRKPASLHFDHFLKTICCQTWPSSRVCRRCQRPPTANVPSVYFQAADETRYRFFGPWPRKRQRC